MVPVRFQTAAGCMSRSMISASAPPRTTTPTVRCLLPAPNECFKSRYHRARDGAGESGPSDRTGT
jgi:hypothetical protein